MRNSILLLVVVSLALGCRSVSKESSGPKPAHPFAEAMQTFKEDYLSVEVPVLEEDRRREIEGIAKGALLATYHLSEYQVWDPQIEMDPGMSEAFSYFFVLFPAIEERQDLADTNFLVVIHRFDNRVVYSDVFSQPPGDSFYRYYHILKKIKAK